MKRSVLFLALVLLLASGARAQGKLSFDVLNHSFGVVEEGVKARHVFTFTNGGDAPLRLVSVRASCGCTTPEWTRDAVPPGGQGAITVVYDSEGRPGEFAKTINVESDGEPELVVLRIDGTVRPLEIGNGVAQGNVVFDAEVQHVTLMEPGRPVSQLFRMKNTGQRPIRIRGAEHAAPNVKVHHPARPVYPGEVVRITVEVDPSSLRGGEAFDYAVVLDTDDPAQPRKSLRLTGAVAGR